MPHPLTLKNSGYFGTLSWRGDDSRMMHLSDIPKYVPLKVGDTVIIIAYAMMTKEEAQNLVPDVVMVDEHNRPVRVRGTELEGEIG